MTNGALMHTGVVNWDRVMERERIRLLVAQAEAAWWGNGGWGDLTLGPIPRPQGVLDRPGRRCSPRDYILGSRSIE